MRPCVSVVVACRNEAATLAECLDALLAQDATGQEIIVVDGGSSDGSREIAARRATRVLDDPAAGPAGARNVGIRAARADIIAFTDADCVPEPDWISRLTEVFAGDASVDGVGGALRMRRATLLGELEDLEARSAYRGFITSNVAYRRPVLLAVGGFDETLRCCEDYDLAWRAMDAGFRIVHDPRPIVTHAPPEIAGSIATYLRKQFWYARADVPAHVRTLARGSERAWPGARDALGNAGWTAAVAAGGLLHPWIAGAALAGLGARAARDVARACRHCGERPRNVAAATGVVLARRLARGAGTLAGLADLARADVRMRISAPAPTGLARSSRALPLVAGSPS